MNHEKCIYYLKPVSGVSALTLVSESGFIIVL